MKKIFSLFALCSLIFITSCGGSDNKEDANLSPNQKQAVAYVRSHLERGVKLADYEVVEEAMPVELLEGEFQSIRNGVFKAGLDYLSCQTRSLDAGMEMAREKISAYQEEIQAKVSELKNKYGNTQMIIVCGKVETKATFEVAPQSLVVVFNPDTMEPECWIPVTVPVQNNAGMVLNGINGTLFDYSINPDHDFKAMADETSDPVVKFVLDSRAV